MGACGKLLLNAAHTHGGKDKRGQEAARESAPLTQSLDDRALALKSYQRSKGLCFVCGKKGHLATSVLHQCNCM
jgi:hypothetical protein